MEIKEFKKIASSPLTEIYTVLKNNKDLRVEYSIGKKPITWAYLSFPSAVAAREYKESLESKIMEYIQYTPNPLYWIREDGKVQKRTAKGVLFVSVQRHGTIHKAYVYLRCPDSKSRSNRLAWLVIEMFNPELYKVLNQYGKEYYHKDGNFDNFYWKNLGVRYIDKSLTMEEKVEARAQRKFHDVGWDNRGCYFYKFHGERISSPSKKEIEKFIADYDGKSQSEIVEAMQNFNSKIKPKPLFAFNLGAWDNR